MRFDLSNRQMQIAELVADGLTNKQISEILDIGVRTVETHIYEIFRKADITNRTELAIIFLSDLQP